MTKYDQIWKALALALTLALGLALALARPLGNGWEFRKLNPKRVQVRVGIAALRRRGW